MLNEPGWGRVDDCSHTPPWPQLGAVDPVVAILVAQIVKSKLSGMRPAARLEKMFGDGKASRLSRSVAVGLCVAQN